jgi:exonuclease VII large subunit
MPAKNGSHAVTRDELRSELAELEARLEARIETRIDDRFRAFEDRITRTIVKLLAQTQTDILDKTQEYVRDAQTELLRGFEMFLKGQSVQFRKLKADVSNLDAATDLRIQAVEQRIFEIEKRLGPPPPLPGDPANPAS